MTEENPIFEKESLAGRMMRDKAARSRRRERKIIVKSQIYKEQKDARERLHAKRLLQRQRRRARRMERVIESV
jgi:hypothetical protein